MPDLLVTTGDVSSPVERVPELRRYSISFSEGAAMVSEYESVYDAFATVASTLAQDHRSNLICEIDTREDAITGVLTVWEGKIRRQHQISIKPWRAAA